ncbi:hypothetical protein CLAVI_000933 [Candidatus Clavichlamydia salmonicola]|uniref:hypothetical protein n=1 Tax=Candidatus Clavichlamydia salmonicola TaxID=469812 RepID=UPI001891D197|nr:hypothetical protein [Candidatus Clavichlamydia salmonicola]MBF5051292.1 hypothetical protein [Candidatus Clavichlamydia salmonicola]
MPYFILDYCNPSLKNSSASFIVQEAHKPLMLATLQSLSSIVTTILDKRLSCSSVPLSFPLNMIYHKSTLSMLQDIMCLLLEYLNKTSPTPEHNALIKIVNKTLTLTFMKYDHSLFQQQLPMIRYLSPNETLAKEAPKDPLKPKEDLEIEHCNLNDMEDYWNVIQELIDENSLPKIDFSLSPKVESIPNPNLILTSSLPTSHCLPLIQLTEDNKYFTIDSKDIFDLKSYLEYMHNKIMGILQNELLLTDIAKQTSPSHSEGHLYNKTLNTLLSLLNELDVVLRLIPENNEKSHLSSENQMLKNDVISRLQAVEFSDQAIGYVLPTAYSSIPSPIFSIDKHLSLSGENELFLLEESVLNPLTTRKKTKTTKQVIESNSDMSLSDDESLSFQEPFIHLKIKRNNECIVSLKNHGPKLALFLIQVEKLIHQEKILIYLNTIEGLDTTVSHSRSEFLKALYFILHKNVSIQSSQHPLHNLTIAKIMNLSNQINLLFCNEIDEPYDPEKHSRHLTENINLFSITLPKLTTTNELSHYQIYLKNYNVSGKIISKLHVEKHACSFDSLLPLLKQKCKMIIHMEITIKNLSKKKFIILGRNCLLHFKKHEPASVAKLSLPLYALLITNKELLTEKFLPTYSKSVIYKRMMLRLTNCIEIIKTCNPEMTFPSLETLSINQFVVPVSQRTLDGSDRTMFVLPLFFIKMTYIKKQPACTLSYKPKIHKSWSNLIKSTYQHLQKLQETIQLLLSLKNIHITYIPYGLEPTQKPITNLEELLPILLQGVVENYLYIFNKHPEQLWATAAYDILSELTSTITLVKNAFPPTIPIPAIYEPTILNQLYQKTTILK